MDSPIVVKSDTVKTSMKSKSHKRTISDEIPLVMGDMMLGALSLTNGVGSESCSK